MSKSFPLGVRGLYVGIWSGGRDRGLIGAIKVPVAGASDDFTILQVNRGPEGTRDQILQDLTNQLRYAAIELGRQGGGLTVYDALWLAKTQDRSFSRRGSKFLSWDDTWTYKFDPEEMLATDWEDVETFIPKLTSGRWGPANYPPMHDPVQKAMDMFPVPDDRPTWPRVVSPLNDETSEVCAGPLTFNCDDARQMFGATTEQINACWRDIEAVMRKHFPTDTH